MKAETHPGLDGVVLVRLLVRPKGFSTSKLGEDLQSLMGLDKAAARKAAEAALARLKERGFIWADTKLLLTDGGEAAALKALGYSSLPKRQRVDWRRAKRILFDRQLDGAPQVVRQGARKSADAAAWIVAQQRGLALPRKRRPTPGAVLRVLAWRVVGGLEGAAHTANPAPVAPLDFRTPAAAFASSNATRPAASPARPGRKRPIRAAAPRTASVPKTAAKVSLPAFAREVNELALSAKEGRWIGQKVFIGQVWKDFSQRGAIANLSIEQFKQRLVEAARASLVLLGRADLMDAYPQEDVRLSQVEVGGHLYHFVETQHLA